jgi:hypothetical protein
MPLDQQQLSHSPVRNVPGNSNLSLLTGVTNYDKSMAPFEALPATVTIDVTDFDLSYKDCTVVRPVQVIEINFEASRYYSVRPNRCTDSKYRSWRRYRLGLVNEENPAELKFTEWDTLANQTRNSSATIGNMPVMDALLVYFTSFASNSVRYEVAAGQDPMGPLRGMTGEEIAGFVTWLFNHDTLSENYSILHSTELVLAWFREDYARIVSGRRSNCAGIGDIVGAGSVRIVSKAERSSAYVDHPTEVERDFIADVIDDRGVFHSRAHVSTLGVELYSPAWYAVELASKCNPITLKALNFRRGIDDTFGDVLDLEGEDVFRELVSFIGEETVSNATVWAKLLANFRAVGGLPVVAPSNFDTNWINRVIDRNSFNVAPTIGDALRYGQRIDISAVDIAEFAKTSIPENGLVKNVKMLKNGKVRVVLREPVYPEFVQRRGATYTENEPGTVLSYMAVHAFDLDFRGTLTQFPNATAYADEECTQTARHTNITSCGRVCLGDINTQMSKQEIEARGGVAMPCVADFVQMLKQCNLDSAYNSSKEFVLLDPGSVTEEQWRAREWDIPGLRRVDQHMNDFKAFMEAMSRAAPASEGQSEETAETEEGEAE